MAENLNQRLAPVSEVFVQRALRFMFQFFYDRLSTQTLTSAGLAINGAGNAAAKAGSAFYSCVQGVLVTKAANTAMAALVGTVANAKFNVYCFFIDSAGNLTSSMGTAGSTLATIIWPSIPSNKAMIGFVIVNPTGTGGFVGGTTALDDATVVPNAVYVNTIGDFEPTAIYTS